MGTTGKYTLFGILFGAMFPLVGIVFDILVGRTGDGYWEILHNNPIHIIVHLAPLVLGVTFNFMGRKARRLKDQLEQLTKAEERIRHTAYHDSLTGLENRSAFTERMAEELEQLRCRDRESALILFDIDKFKFINDTLGHNTGDELIKQIICRSSAILPEQARLYRLGGDEFVGLWCDPPDTENLLHMVQKLVDECAEPFALTNASVSVGVSVGVSWLCASDTAETQALERADLALYHAKNSSGSTYAVFDPAMAGCASGQLKLQGELKQALSDDQLELAYQPIMNIDGVSVIGFEALIRWQHPVRGLVMPDIFIDAAEQSGLIVPIGRYVLHRACEEAKGWPDDVSVSVNLSPVQLKDRGLVETVSTVLRQTGLPGRRLILEITESVFQIDPNLVRKSLTSLRNLGIRIALDDFGTGFSGINHLRHFTIDILKIDRQYTQAMVSSDRERMLVQTIVALSKALDLRITFEGVETHEQLMAAAALGGSSIQGYYASRPLHVQAVREFLAGSGRQVHMAIAG
ncbi:MAG: putative bifunctional diguanylate cyclase/phosphodiesterase [Geminicoccaceae bacterium]